QIQRRLHRPTLEYRHRRHNLNFWSLARMVRRIRPKATLSFRSVLLGPPNTWKKEGLWGKINSLQTPLPIGAYLGLCIDTMPRVPLTPLFLRAKEKAFKVYTGLQPEASREGAPSRP
ncbi:MAG: class I SAM-dependent methyltransferase, partial [Bilophila wadsworthia]